MGIFSGSMLKDDFFDRMEEDKSSGYDSREDTIKHREIIKNYSNGIIGDIEYRIDNHDMSKLEEPEKSVYDKITPKLKETVYGSDEYKKCLKDMDEGLSHHHKNNRHHPEHFENGIKGMNLIDVLEMTLDWKAASVRSDTDIYKGIELNQNRFGFSDELKQIIINTVDEYLKD